MKKYELTTNVKTVLGRKLFQIKALISFDCIEAGELGGWIEKESNLSQSGDAWVSGHAWVSGNARVFGNAEVSGNADHLVIGPIGSRKGYTTFYRRNDGVTMVVCGCFHDTIDAFEEQVVRTHGVNEHAKAYQAAVQFVKAVINTDPVEEVPSDE